MTKAVTSVAAMQLVEQDMSGLDEPLAERLSELAPIQVLEGFDAAGAHRLRPPRRPITLRHLLTHTAGFTYDIRNADMIRYQEYTRHPPHHRVQESTLVLGRRPEPVAPDGADRSTLAVWPTN